jgi:hypothetical protein
MEYLNMTKQIGIYDFATDEYVVRDMTAEELAEHELGVEADNQIQQEAATMETERAALLSKLGITADEAKLLLG